MKHGEKINEELSLSATTASSLELEATKVPSATGGNTLRAVHIVSGDRWAGAEVQVFTLLKQLRAHVDLHVIIMNTGELAQRCESLGISLTILDESQLSALETLQAIRKCLNTFKPNIVHTHRQKENILGSVANLFSCRARCVRTVHGAPEFLPTFRQKLQRQIDVLCGRFMQQGIIAVSADLKEKLAVSFAPEHLYVISNGIDPDEVIHDAQPPLSLPGGDQVRHVGLVGRLEAVKRPDLFLHMAALVIQRNDLKQNAVKPWHFHIFGDGSLAAPMRKMAQDLGINDSVYFHGHRQDSRRAIAALDVVVMPSDHEGLPITALETLALGVRLLAHDTGGLRELLADQSHFLVRDHSAEGYANALLAIMDQAPSSALNPSYLASTNAEQVLTLYQHLSRHALSC